MRSLVSKGRLPVLAAEFVLIVAGVLVALALDQWRARLHDRTLESEYVLRLRNDLANDTSSFRWFNGFWILKTASSMIFCWTVRRRC
jgi:uncharacterized protein YjeT (DUF2065 family)